MPSKEKKLEDFKRQRLEADTKKHRLLRKRTLNSYASIPDLKKTSIQMSSDKQIGERPFKKTKIELQVTPNSNASLSSETEAKLAYMKYPKCKSSIKYQKNLCNKEFAYMKSCVVVLDIFPGLDINTRGNMLFFQCRQCRRFFIDGYSYSQHLTTHHEVQFDRSIKTISLNINSSYPTIDDDQMLLDADKNISNNGSKVSYLNPDKSTGRASRKKSRFFYCIPNVKSNASLSSETESKLACMKCPKCFYKCKSSIKYQKHSCDKTLAYMKSCVVVLNIFPGLDINTRGNLLFFQCRKCSRFFIDGYSYSQHLLTHPEMQFNRNIETMSLNINSAYPTPTIDADEEMCLDATEEVCLDATEEVCLDAADEICLDAADEMCLVAADEMCLHAADEMCLHAADEMCLDTDENISNNGSNVTFLNPDASASPDSRDLATNAQEKSRSFCCIS